MFQVECPKCGKVRVVKARKKWMVGDSPYQMNCQPCSQKGKPKSEEHKRNLSKSVKAAQTPELLKEKSDFMKNHPELWKGRVATGNGGGWNKGLKMEPRSEETRNKISNSMKKEESND